LRAAICSRSAGDVEKGEEFVCRAPLESLGDVVGNRERTAVELVALRPGDLVLCREEEVFAAFGETDCLLPDGQVFESFVGHGFLRFEI